MEHVQNISLDIKVGELHLKDSFQWDLSNPDNSPEEFAACLVSDLYSQMKKKPVEFSHLEYLE